MKNYMLICCCERDIEAPKFFDTHEEAHEAMAKDLADVLGMTKEEVMESYLEGKELGFYACLNYDSAWSDRHTTCDWQIFYIGGDR